jgi:DmsE family decaheme c-type cytochrome
MKLLRKVMLLCAFIAGMGALPSLMAADEAPAEQAQPAAANRLPDMSMEGVAPKTAAEALKKDAICTRCHDETETVPILSIYQTPHGVKGDLRTPTCQSCHGESENHLKGNVSGKGRPAPDVEFAKHTFPASDAKVRAEVCLTCHKGTARTNWDGSQHQVNGMACNDCHKVHQPVDKVRQRITQREVCFTCHKEQRADTHKISTHPIDAGKVVCSDCHNPHGSTAPKLLKKNTVNETCWQCHADKRGPFLWEHQPVTENCTNCHTPHGSNITPLLKDRPPFLCQDCHDGPHNSKVPYGPGVTAAGNDNGAGRACMNCHVMVHGSNSPTGAFLHR